MREAYLRAGPLPQPPLPILGEGEQALSKMKTNLFSSPALPLAQDWERGLGGEGPRVGKALAFLLAPERKTCALSPVQISPGMLECGGTLICHE